MDVLRPVIRPYSWGSRHAIAELQGRPPADGPEAELWMGAHPSAPSGLTRAGTASTLDRVIAADPVAELGAQTVRRFGPRLPFLLKVLAAEQALSIQVHPSRARAQAGYRAETERGLPPGDPARNYVDDWPKPELLIALTPFEVLAGLREAADAAALLRALDVPALAPLASRLAAASGSGPAALAGALRAILTWPQAGRAALVADVAAACARLSTGRYGPACAALAKVAADHPGDIGLIAALAMRHAVLQPGQAVFMPAGGLHAYLRGTGVEVLANSDNVVRAGLTGKHVDVPELLALVDPAVPVPVLAPRELAPGIAVYDTPAPEFRAFLLQPAASPLTLPPAPAPAPAALAAPAPAAPAPAAPDPAAPDPAAPDPAAPDAPRIALCVAGTAVLRAAARAGQPARTLTLARGQSCFLPACCGPVQVTGPARLFLATVGTARLASLSYTADGRSVR